MVHSIGRTACGTSTEPASRVPAGRRLPVQLRADGPRHRRPHQPDMCRDLRPHLHPGGDALYLLESNTQRRPLMPCGGRASQRDTRRPGPGAGFAAHRRVLQGAPAPCRDAAAPPDAPERTAAPAAGAHGLALARTGRQDRGWLGGLHARHGGQPTGRIPSLAARRRGWAFLSPASSWCCRWPVARCWRRRWGGIKGKQTQ